MYAIILFFAGYVASAQVVESNISENAPEFEWISSTYEFGNIPQNVPAQARYEFKNVGREPLIISEVQKTCGCTKTDWSKEPVMPGQKGFIMAEYNAASEGAFTKNITVVSNATTSSVKLNFKGTVLKGDTGSVPEEKTIFNN